MSSVSETAHATINVAINGAAGRMGRRLVALAVADPDMSLLAAIESDGSQFQGQDAGQLAGVGDAGISIATSEVFESTAKPDCVIDFSSDAGAAQNLQFCKQHTTPVVVATTGLEPSTVDLIKEVSKSIPVVYAPNMSMAVNLTMKLVETAARALAGNGAGVDVEIIERHHRFKADSPSGTALKFGEIVAGELGQKNHQHGREGMIGQRPTSEIGYHAIRAGDDPGQHTILFGMQGELIELRVAASNRDCYAAGALAAAKFLVGRPPGLYSMYDVLGI